jgi:predicted metal-dependent peptidase
MLKDLKKISTTEEFKEFNQKLLDAMCACIRHPKDGGNPLVYLSVATVPHYLQEELRLVPKTLHEFNLLPNLCEQVFSTNERIQDDTKYRMEAIECYSEDFYSEEFEDVKNQSPKNVNGLRLVSVKIIKNPKYQSCDGLNDICIYAELPFSLDIISQCDWTVEDTFTASTNGKCVNWSKKFLKRSIHENCVTLIHEGLHILLAHCEQNFKGKIDNEFKRFIMNVALDVTVNSIIKKTFIDNNFGRLLWSDRVSMSVDDFIDCVNSQTDFELRKKTKPVYLKAYREGFVIPDLTMFDKTAIEIYNYIIERIITIPDNCDIPYYDNHPKIVSLTDDERMQQLLKAKSFSNSCGYNNHILTEGINHFIDKLYKPKLKLGNMLKILYYHKKIKNGLTNNYKSYKKRFINSNLYYPEKIKFKASFLIFIDTSGSMNEDTLIKCISELRLLDASAIIVPGDTQCYWDKTTSIDDLTSIKELLSINLVGGGGTDFNCFFEEYPKKVGTDFAGIIILTDGGFNHDRFVPRIQNHALWVISDPIDFTPPFGKRVYLK